MVVILIIMINLENGSVIIMIESYYKILNAKDTIKDAMPQIIEAFVEQYGENRREEITKKLSSVVIVPYILPNDLEHLLEDIKREESKNIQKEFFDRNGIEFNEDNLKKYFGNFTMEHFTSHPIYFFWEYLKCVKEDKHDNNIYSYKTLKDRAFKYLKPNYPNLDFNNLEIWVKNGAFDKKEVLAKMYIGLKEEYCERTKCLEQYENQVEKEKKLKRQLNKKYYLKFINEFINIIPNKELEKIKQYVQDPNEILFENNIPYTNSFLGIDLQDNLLISYFSLANEEILNNPNESEWRKKTIKEKRVKFFKGIGIDLGNNYDDYINNEECLKVIPSQDFIKRVEECRKNNLDQLKIEYYTSISEYKKIQQKLKDENFLDKDVGLSPKLFDKKSTCVCPNVDKNTMELKPVLFLNLDSYKTEYGDQILMHELNHVFELVLTGVDKNKLEYISGWDIVESRLNSTNEINFEPRKKRNVELINEIVNENLSQEITSKLQERGVFIFGNKDISKVVGAASYEILNHLIRNFYDKYRNDIISSRSDGNFEQIINLLGKDNFDELVILCNDFYRKFGIFRLAGVYSALKKNEETEDTILFKQMKAQEMEIMDRMETFSRGRHL